MSLKDKIAIIGVGSTTFGENFQMSYADQIREATSEAMLMAGISPKDVQAAWLGTAFPDMAGYDGHSGSSLAGALNLYDIPISRNANYCATGMDAFRNACFAVAAGAYDTVLVVGCEKMRDVAPRESLVGFAVKNGHPLYCKGLTAPGMFAMSASKYLSTYGLTREAFARVAVKNHIHGTLNPKAHFQKETTIEKVLNAPMIAEPLGLLDCCPTTDGAAALVITSKAKASGHKKDFAVVKGIGLSVSTSDAVFYNGSNDFLGFRSTQKAAEMAYKEAGITNPVGQLSLAEVHDCFTITELLNYEDLGFCKRGEGWKFVLEGRSFLGGDLPVNPSGGLKSCGHPIGATGVRMLYELTLHLVGQAGKRQVHNPRLGLAHNLGGPGSVACVTILGLP